MLREKHFIFRNIQILLDIIITIGAFFLAYYLRFSVEILPVTKGYPGFKPYLYLAIPISIIWFTIFYFSGLYISRRTRPLYEEFTVIIIDVTLAFLCLLTVLFFYKNFSYSSLVMGLFYILDIYFLITFRIILRKLLHFIRKKGLNLRYVLIIGTNEKAWEITKIIKKHPEYGLKLIGFLKSCKEAKVFNNIISQKIIGTIEDLEKLLNKFSIDIVIITLPYSELSYITKVTEILMGRSIQIKIIPDTWQFILKSSSVEDFDGIALLNVGVKPISGMQAILKRIMDVVISFALLILLSPLFLIIAIGIKLSSRGPIFYIQERIGLDGRPFNIIKFRTMKVDAEKETGPVMVTSKDDKRCFPFGKFLRRFNLDELPQLINVLKGEMSLVGPRPERPYFAEKFREKIPRYIERQRVKCGITGWAQINGLRGGDTPIDKRIEYDLYYIENWSILLDIEILIGTLLFGWRNAK